MQSALSSPKDWIPRYIERIYLWFNRDTAVMICELEHKRNSKNIDRDGEMGTTDAHTDHALRDERGKLSTNQSSDALFALSERHGQLEWAAYEILDKKGIRPVSGMTAGTGARPSCKFPPTGRAPSRQLCTSGGFWPSLQVNTPYTSDQSCLANSFSTLRKRFVDVKMCRAWIVEIICAVCLRNWCVHFVLKLSTQFTICSTYIQTC